MACMQETGIIILSKSNYWVQHALNYIKCMRIHGHYQYKLYINFTVLLLSIKAHVYYNEPGFAINDHKLLICGLFRGQSVINTTRANEPKQSHNVQY